MTKRIISILILLAVLLTACSSESEKKKSETTSEQNGVFDLPDGSVPAQSGSNAQEPNGGDSEDPKNESADGETQNNANPDSDDPIIDETMPSSGESVPTEPSNDTPNGSTEPNSSAGAEPTEPQNTDTRIYEDYLAALSLLALSMEYPDFQLQGIYSSDKVTIGEKFNSKGIYVMFESGGSDLAAHVYPIEEERTEPGTMDIYSAELGVAAFDLVGGTYNNYPEITQDTFAILISELSGVSIFSH